MHDSVQSDNQFVIDMLTTLRCERFSLGGWWHFLARSWHMSCTTARNNPQLTRSWLSTTTLIVVLMVGALASTWIVEGGNAALRLLPGFIFCVAWQQSDLFWHLGLNRQSQTGELLQHLGPANTLTVLRGLASSYLLSRLIAALSTPAPLALSIIIFGAVTDILDGQIARRTGTQSRLGQILDGEVDFTLSLALTLILLQNGLLSLGVGMVILLRFFVPLLAALVSYFLFARPVRFGSTIWGKYAGTAQYLYFVILLAPHGFASITHIISLPLLIITLLLLVIAPVAQIAAN